MNGRQDGSYKINFHWCAFDPEKHVKPNPHNTIVAYDSSSGRTVPFLRNFHWGGGAKVKIALKYGMSNLRLPQPVHLSGASWGS